MHFRGRQNALARCWQGTARFCLALLLLAAVRGLVPSLCANQASEAAAGVYGADSELCAVHDCCVAGLLATARGNTDSGTPARSERPCAFCTLAATLVEPLEMAALPLPSALPACTALCQSGTPSASCTLSTAHLRGPPAIGLNQV